MRTAVLILFVFISLLTACESSQERAERVKVAYEKNEKEKANAEILNQKRLAQKVKEDKERLIRKERENKRRQLADQKEQQRRLEKEQKRKELEKWKNNSLKTGATPWSDCFGSDNSCSYACNEIKVRTPSSSNVMVTIKQNGDVVRHAYIKKNSSYTFNLPNGTYQPFFYYGNGWNPNKSKRSAKCGSLSGAFISGEEITKDRPQTLTGNILEYQLILQENGNLQTKSSNESEAF